MCFNFVDMALVRLDITVAVLLKAQICYGNSPKHQIQQITYELYCYFLRKIQNCLIFIVRGLADPWIRQIELREICTPQRIYTL